MSFPGQPPRHPYPPQGGYRQPPQARPAWGQPTLPPRPTPGFRPAPNRAPMGGQRPMPQQQWQPPAANFGRQQQWSAPPKKQGSGCGMAAGVIFIGAIAFMIFLGSVLQALVGDTDPVPSPSSAAVTSPGKQSPSNRPTSPSPSSARSSTTPRSAPPSVISTHRQHPAGNYENDGYKAPGIDPNFPRPTINSREHGDQMAKNNPIYRLHLNKPVRCDVDVIDYDKATNDERMRQLVVLRDCYLRVWGPLLEQAGFTMITPEVFLAYPETETPCGKAEPQSPAFFCPANQAIYMMVGKFHTQKMPNGAIHPTFEVMFAHEFGHHIQHRTGIMYGAWWVVYDQDKQAQLHSSRRLELQAQCLGGMSIQATAYSMGFSDYDINQMYQYESRRLTDAAHSSGQLQGLWWYHGTQHTRIGECNTYLADAKMIDY